MDLYQQRIVHSSSSSTLVLVFTCLLASATTHVDDSLDIR